MTVLSFSALSNSTNLLFTSARAALRPLTSLHLTLDPLRPTTVLNYATLLSTHSYCLFCFPCRGCLLCLQSHLACASQSVLRSEATQICLRRLKLSWSPQIKCCPLELRQMIWQGIEVCMAISVRLMLKKPKAQCKFVIVNVCQRCLTLFFKFLQKSGYDCWSDRNS